jgi:hypothetical protein
MRVASEASKPPPTYHQMMTGYRGLLATTIQATAAVAEASGSVGGRAAGERPVGSSPFVTPAPARTAAPRISAGDSITRSPAAASPADTYVRAPPADCGERTWQVRRRRERGRRAVCTEPKRPQRRIGEASSTLVLHWREANHLRSGGHDSGREFALGRRRRKGAHAEPGLGSACADIGAPS